MTSIPVKLPKKRHKYAAKSAACNAGHSHPSRKEANRCNELYLLQRGGVICDLVVEPQYWFKPDGRQLMHENGRRAGYKPDFGYVEAGQRVVEDVKSEATKTGDYVLRRQLFRHLFPDIELREV